MSPLFPQHAYPQLGFIMGFPGTLGLEGFASEAVFTQDLSRLIIDSRVKRLLYTSAAIATASGTADTVFEWADASDWAEVQSNGVVMVADSEMAQVTDERIIIAASLTMGGVTPAHMTSAELTRTAPVAGYVRQSCVEWGAATTSHLSASIEAPYLLPQTLSINETAAFLRIVGSGTAGTATLAVSMLAAERGVMNLYPGV